MAYKAPSLLKKIKYKITENTQIFCGNMFTRPDKKLIVFSSEPDFSDNAYVLFNYMQKKGYSDKYNFVWLVSDINNFKDKQAEYKNTLFVQKNDEFMHLRSEAIKYLMSAHYYIGTHIRQKRIRKSGKGQIILNLWHGCGYKDTQHMPWNDAFDYVIVPGDVFIETKSVFFGCKKEQILPLGYPRSDLFKEKSENADRLIKSFKRNPETKVVIWMPTFRKTGKDKYPEEKIIYDFALPALKSMKELEALDEVCREKNIVILIKKHQYQADFQLDSKSLTNILFIDNNTFVNNNVQLYEFLHLTDALISDYSSVAIDYLLVDKPIGFTLDDYEQYKKTRGFVFENPLDFMPGSYLYNLNDLIKFIYDISDNSLDEYKAERERVRLLTNKYKDNFCQRIIDKMEI